jgi:hypothetical protein
MAHSRWVAYGIAGAATALGATTAGAEIHYSGIIDELIFFTEATFPLSNGAVLWFKHSGENTSYRYAYFELRSAAVSNGWRSDSFYGYRRIKRLALNHPVANAKAASSRLEAHFGQGSAALATSPFCDGYEFCEHKFGGNFGILGFKFNTGGGTQFGWARVRMRVARFPPENGFYVVDYAWADVGEEISTGQTDSLSQEQGAVSPSGSLGLLALGKAGLELWRTQRLSCVGSDWKQPEKGSASPLTRASLTK